MWKRIVDRKNRNFGGKWKKKGKIEKIEKEKEKKRNKKNANEIIESKTTSRKRTLLREDENTGKRKRERKRDCVRVFIDRTGFKKNCRSKNWKSCVLFVCEFVRRKKLEENAKYRKMDGKIKNQRKKKEEEIEMKGTCVFVCVCVCLCVFIGGKSEEKMQQRKLKYVYVCVCG